MRKLIALLAVIALVATISAVSAFATTKSVKWKIGSKTTVAIHKGDAVKWVWSDGQPHNVKASTFKSKVVAKKGFAFSHTFRAKGTFRIVCQVHPTQMKTVVKVG
jgi:plastocyanin